MSIVQDPVTEETETEVTEVVEQQELPLEAEASNEEPKEPELPEKFQGKSAKEIAEAYENLEKELGRKGQEVGELRKLTDEILKSQISQVNTQPEPQEEVDFYDNPQRAVEQAVENHPKFKQLEEQAKAQQAQAAIQQVEKAHPDYMNVVTDPKFQEWVGESPVRQQLFRAADQYNFDAANELLTTWKERQLIEKTREAKEAEEAKRAEALKAGAGESRSSGESTSGKKIYRRADLIRLKQEDPRRYDALQDEILQAYAEGRIK